MKGLILVTGSEGLVGSRFVEISKRKNFLHFPKQVEFDITNPNEVENILSSYNFSAIVNFAAYTDVGRAEEERGNKDGICWQVNVEGVRNLVEAVKSHRERIHFIQISTDMVFSGNSEDPGPYREDHTIEENLDILTWYGYTKGQAEKTVRKVLGDHASIVRIIYPVRANFPDKLDYIRKPLKLYDTGSLYPLFTDQQISITYIDELCKFLDKIIIDNLRGIFHVSSKDITTPYDLISEVIEKTRSKSNVVNPITLDKFLMEKGFPQFRYPHFGGLSVAQTEQKLGIRFSNWNQIVDELVAQGLGGVQ